MAVRHEPVQFADIVVIKFQFQYSSKALLNDTVACNRAGLGDELVGPAGVRDWLRLIGAQIDANAAMPLMA
jgi:hypothetical protein